MSLAAGKLYMIAKNSIILGLKMVALTVILLLSFMIASLISGVSAPQTAPEGPAAETEASAAVGLSHSDAKAVLPLLALASFLQVVVFTYIILRSRWYGWKLAVAAFVAFYGLMTVIAQIESVVFLPDKLPPDMIPKLFLMGAIIAGVFCPLAVLIMGGMRSKSEPRGSNLHLILPAPEWVWKLLVIMIGYLILYFGFGYFVAWKQPAVQEYYGGTDPGSFFAQMGVIWKETPWMFALQAFRALLWTAFALPVIRMLKGGRWEAALVVAMLFAVWSGMLLLPNPYMPQAVARTHLIETAPSNLIFGFLVGWLLSKHHRSLRRQLLMTNNGFGRR